jgi:threonyl-tRNA synthetase
MINITLPDGSVRQYEKGTTALQIATSISEGLARNVLAAKVNLSTSPETGFEVWDAVNNE